MARERLPEAARRRRAERDDAGASGRGARTDPEKSLQRRAKRADAGAGGERSAVEEALARLVAGGAAAIAEAAPRLREARVDPYAIGRGHEVSLAGDARRRARARAYVTEGSARRSTGAHYTPQALARELAAAALAPLLAAATRPEEVLALRVCDAAMGAGAFLLAACEVLAERLVAAGFGDAASARRIVANTCLFGVDRDPVAVALARVALWLMTESEEEPSNFLRGALHAGDALVGPPGAEPPWPAGVEPFDWRAAFPEVLGAGGGFDAIVGNPPWVSYAGRAAQPLDAALFDFHVRTSPAFFGYRNLQGLFVHRAATLLRPGGRLGLLVPTSMSDLAGYEPSRRAHDALCATDGELPDYGDRFEEVFQPCMGVLSTRRAEPIAIERAGAWPLARRDLDAGAAALLRRLEALPKLPAELFGERGYQTMGGDVSRLRSGDEPPADGEVGLRVGGDVAPFRRGGPSFRCDPRALSGRFRAAEEWQAVRVLVRQTARFPMACLSDGMAFRNSVLAGFEAPGVRPELLVAYLNSWPVRWFHYTRHRDARQGMPQLKIGHLRALPAPAEDSAKRAALEEVGAMLSARNDGARPEEERALSELAADLLGLDAEERAIVAAWAARFVR